MKFGSDPEMFLVDNNGFVIPPLVVEKMGLKRIGTLDESRPNYHPVYFDDVIQLIGDGAAFEFNTPPAFSVEELLASYAHGKEILQRIADETNLHIAAVPAAKFELNMFGEYFPDPMNNEELWYSCRFGCDAQFNIYQMNKSPEIDAKEIKWRYAGGHIHASGFDFDIFEYYHEYVRLMDIVVGTGCLLHSPYGELEFQRQLFYGVPGNYRPQHYPNGDVGIEYRTPSVSWLETDVGVEQVFSGISCVEKIISDGLATEVIEEYNEMAVDSILQFDLEVANKIQKEVRSL